MNTVTMVTSDKALHSAASARSAEAFGSLEAVFEELEVLLMLIGEHAADSTVVDTLASIARRIVVSGGERANAEAVALGGG